MLSLLRCIDLFKFCIVSTHTFAHYTHMHMNRHLEMSHCTSWLDWMRSAKLAWWPFFSWYGRLTLRVEDEILVAILITHPGLCNRYQHCALKVPVSAHLCVYMCHDSNLSCLLASVTLQSKLQRLNEGDNGVCLWWQEPVTLLPVLPRLHSHEKFWVNCDRIRLEWAQI